MVHYTVEVVQERRCIVSVDLEGGQKVEAAWGYPIYMLNRGAWPDERMFDLHRNDEVVHQVIKSSSIPRVPSWAGSSLSQYQTHFSRQSGCRPRCDHGSDGLRQEKTTTTTQESFACREPESGLAWRVTLTGPLAVTDKERRRCFRQGVRHRRSAGSMCRTILSLPRRCQSPRSSCCCQGLKEPHPCW